MNRRFLLFAVAALVAVLTVAGTALWIVHYARPAPAVAPAPVRASRFSGGTLVLVVEAGPASHAIDRAAATIADLARAIASGRTGTAAPVSLVDVAVESGGRPLMRLLYTGGVLASGAVAGETPDHLLGLAGAGSRRPPSTDPAARAYCNRFDTATGAFCKTVAGLEG